MHQQQQGRQGGRVNKVAAMVTSHPCTTAHRAPAARRQFFLAILSHEQRVRDFTCFLKNRESSKRMLRISASTYSRQRYHTLFILQERRSCIRHGVAFTGCTTTRRPGIASPAGVKSAAPLLLGLAGSSQAAGQGGGNVPAASVIVA